nr:MAG TPA: hypothetical protein [Caudoviricetes sp.]
MRGRCPSVTGQTKERAGGEPARIFIYYSALS